MDSKLILFVTVIHILIYLSLRNNNNNASQFVFPLRSFEFTLADKIALIFFMSEGNERNSVT